MKKLLLIIGFAFTSALFAQTNDTTVYQSVETMPRWSDCVSMTDEIDAEFCTEDKAGKFLQSNINHSVNDMGHSIQLWVEFVVEKDGSVSNVKPLASPSQKLSTEAIRVVKSMPKFIPGKKDGNIVRCKLKLSMKFEMK